MMLTVPVILRTVIFSIASGMATLPFFLLSLHSWSAGATVPIRHRCYPFCGW
jgi:hypothetical protein